MALPVTDQLITQMMTENVGTSPTTPMEGNVSRPLIIKDLLSAMKDVNFSQLVKEYGNMAGLPSENATPMVNALMAKKEQVPETPLKKAEDTTPPIQPTIPPPMPPGEIKVPTPMTDAMAMNTLSPTNSIVDKKSGLMNQSKGLQKPV